MERIINKNSIYFYIFWVGLLLIITLLLFTFDLSSYRFTVLFVILISAILICFPFFIHRPELAMYSVILVFPFSKFIFDLGFFTLEPWFAAFILMSGVILINIAVRKMRLRLTPFDLFIWLFFSAALISTAQAINPARSFIRLFKLMFLFSFYFLSVNLIRDRSDYKRLLKIFVIAALIPVIGAFVEILLIFLKGQTDFYRLIYITSTFRNPVEMSGLMALVIPFSLGLYFERNYIFNKNFHLVMVLMFLFTIGLSQTRTSLLAISVPMLFYLNKKRLWYFVTAGLVGIVILMFIPGMNWFGARYLYYLAPEKYPDFFVKRNSYSSAGHFYVNKLMLDITREHPIFGVGLNNFKFKAMEKFRFNRIKVGGRYINYKHTSIGQNPEQGRVSHSFFLNMLVSTGILGFSLLLIFLSAVIINLLIIIRSRDDLGNGSDLNLKVLARALLAGFTGYLIYNIFQEIGMAEVRFWIYLILIASLIKISRDEKRKKGSNTIH